MAHLASQTTRTGEGRLAAKCGLLRLLYERGYRRKDIISLLRFIDWLLRLPENLEQKFQAQVEEFEKGKAMPYVTSFERIGIKRGLRSGLRKGLVEGIKTGLELLFGKKGLKLIPRIRKLEDVLKLRKIKQALLQAESVADVERLLEKGRRK